MTPEELAEWWHNTLRGKSDIIIKNSDMKLTEESLWENMPEMYKEAMLLTARELQKKQYKEIEKIISEEIDLLEDEDGFTSEKNAFIAFGLLELRDKFKSYFSSNQLSKDNNKEGASVATEDESRNPIEITSEVGSTVSVATPMLDEEATERFLRMIRRGKMSKKQEVFLKGCIDTFEKMSFNIHDDNRMECPACQEQKPIRKVKK
jgi:hypothetical protein